MEQRLWVSGPMPGMNQILDYKSRTLGGYLGGRGKKYNLYNAEKKIWAEKIRAHAEAQRLQPTKGPVFVTFFVLEPDRRRDPDNFCSGAIKFILDALVKTGHIEGDGWKAMQGFVSYWAVSDLPGVAVFIRSDRVLTREECNEGQREVDLG